jgi:copper chaperone NosL
MNKHLWLNIWRDRARLKAALLICALLIAACGKTGIEPADIAAEDMCAFCKMAISERRYAAEFLNRDGDAFKFDDLGCLTNYLRAKQNRDDIAAYFVMDYDAEQWVRGEQAYFVSSPEFKTPMGGGIAAFKDRSKAEEAAAKYQGKLMSFGEVFGAGLSGRATSTGQGACLSTRSVFEPNRARIAKPAPCAPMQIRSILFSSA